MTTEKLLERKMWLSPSGGTATIECDMHTAELLKKCNYKEGVFLFLNELRALITEAVEMAREPFGYWGNPEDPAFSTDPKYTTADILAKLLGEK